MSSAASTPLDAAEQVIRAMDAAFVRNANASNATALTEEFYAEDARLLPPNSPLVRGREAIRSFWERFLAAGCSDLKLETGEIGASGDLAYGVGNYEYTQAGTRHAGKYVVVYRRQPDGGFRAVADSFSSND
ncbi:MAG TPA: nuclear transport factor 2 family protein [Clostridia bacterium]|nr:nuclear transport factor 2 family protein [Clostridia bacterium]